MNQALIANVARSPAQTLNMVLSRPTMLADESLATVEKVVKIWVREGLVDRVAPIVEASGLNAQTRTLVRRVCLRTAAVAKPATH